MSLFAVTQIQRTIASMRIEHAFLPKVKSILTMNQSRYLNSCDKLIITHILSFVNIYRNLYDKFSRNHCNRVFHMLIRGYSKQLLMFWFLSCRLFFSPHLQHYQCPNCILDTANTFPRNRGSVHSTSCSDGIFYTSEE